MINDKNGIIHVPSDQAVPLIVIVHVQQTVILLCRILRIDHRGLRRNCWYCNRRRRLLPRVLAQHISEHMRYGFRGNSRAQRWCAADNG